MKIIDVDQVPKSVLPKHYGHYSQEIRGPNTGNPDLSVLVCGMEAEGGAEMHTHDQQEHIFYVLEGEVQVNDGERAHVVRAGQAMVIEPGDPHEVTGTRRGTLGLAEVLMQSTS
ncbi:MAG: cupin domain-containing protein [Anaerolineae bacterium]|nr:cupin domain-containing protein [Anaerolineae bacterium]NIN95332.1 cupin domain-containing protein [Anaerolineae bacterium]NIQ78296.1 cupin domain-containing protein [Anaerolineae bacterium]